jgi:ribose transport system ATP-binding protein
MVGRTLENKFPKEYGVKGDCMLKVEDLTIGGVLNGVNLEAYGGQILGMAGLVGAGRTETMRAVFGADPIDGGKIYVKGKEVRIKSPKQAIAEGIALLTEDRKGSGLVLQQTIRTNLILSSFKKHSDGLFLNEKRIENASKQGDRRSFKQQEREHQTELMHKSLFAPSIGMDNREITNG